MIKDESKPSAYDIFKGVYASKIEQMSITSDVSADLAVSRLLEECRDEFDNVLKNGDIHFVYKCFKQVDMVSYSGNIDMVIWYLINGTHTPAFSEAVNEFFSYPSKEDSNHES